MRHYFLRAMTHWGWALLLGLTGSVQAQFGSGFSALQNDSTLIALQADLHMARHDTTRIDLLEKMSAIYLNQDKPDSAFQVLQRGLYVASQTRRPLDLGRMHRVWVSITITKSLLPNYLTITKKRCGSF